MQTKTSNRHRERLAMGAGAVLTVAEAVALLPIADREARTWLRQEDLIRDLAGRPVVRWADVLVALSAGAEPGADPLTMVHGTLPRVQLEPI